MDEMRLMGIGMIGSGFSHRAFKRGLGMDPHVIASDAGTSDLGPLTLGTGTVNKRGIRHDLNTLVPGARSIGVPFIIGSVGTAGGEAQVRGVADIVKDVAREHGLHFRMALLNAELEKDYLKKQLVDGKIEPFGPVPALTAEKIDHSDHIVGMMGVEPFTDALEQGADVIIGGRCVDPTIFAGPMLRAGFPEGLSWHAAKTMDKGPLMTKPVQEGSCALIRLRKDHFVAEPTKESCVCTVRTVAGITLYESPDPYYTKFPSGTLDTSGCRFEQIDERSVKVWGAEWAPSDRYTVKLEGAALVGYRSIAMMGIRDPVLIKHLDSFLDDVRKTAERNMAQMGVQRERYTVRFRVFGRDAIMGENEPLRDQPAHEVGILVEAVAEDQSTATLAVARHTGVAGHVEFPGRLTTAGNTAAPFPGGPAPAGPVYEWSVWHLMETSGWRETHSVEIVDV